MNGLSDVKRTLNGRYAVADGGRTADRRWSDFEEKTFDDMGRKSISWISTYVCSKNIQNFDMAHVTVYTVTWCHCDTTFNGCDMAVLSYFRTRLLEHAVIEGI